MARGRRSAAPSRARTALSERQRAGAGESAADAGDVKNEAPHVASPLVAVLDYGIGNLRSAQKALERVGADARLTADPALVADAAAVVLPGVGAFGRCMAALRDTGL